MLPPNAMSAPAPLFSVIVACKNPGPRLRAALASVWAQRGASCEAVVIDGGSRDGTCEWLESRRTELGALVSEPDAGVYDAMNKGVARARGTWLLFLGADDRLAGDEVLAQVATHLGASQAAVGCGRARFEDGRWYAPAPAWAAIRRNFLHHQATFYRHALFEEHGGFDAGLRIMGDYDFNLRLLRRGAHFEAWPVHVAECAAGGLSDGGSWQGYREEITVRHRHFSAWRCWPWDLGSVVRYVRKRVLRRNARKRPE